MEIDKALVGRLVAAQFPQWAELPITDVDVQGWDNRTFRLGDDMSVRLPSAEGYVAQVEKEHSWLPVLAPVVPLPIPESLALGEPGEGYPWRWSVRGWLDGAIASRDRIGDLERFAGDLAEFLLALQQADTSGAPLAGAHNFHRGGSLAVYDEETRAAIDALSDRIDATLGTEVWETALESTWSAAPVWVHGDVALANLLVDNGRLAAVIDFGSSAVGDPACDLVISWTFLSGESRAAFRAAIGGDDALWARARGWALWKALITEAAATMVNPSETSPIPVIETLLAEHRTHG